MRRGFSFIQHVKTLLAGLTHRNHRYGQITVSVEASELLQQMAASAGVTGAGVGTVTWVSLGPGKGRAVEPGLL